MVGSSPASAPEAACEVVIVPLLSFMMLDRVTNDPAAVARLALAAGHARQQQTLHVVIAVERFSEGIDAANARDGKAGLKPQELGDVGSCLFGPAEMAQ